MKLTIGAQTRFGLSNQCGEVGSRWIRGPRKQMKAPRLNQIWIVRSTRGSWESSNQRTRKVDEGAQVRLDVDHQINTGKLGAVESQDQGSSWRCRFFGKNQQKIGDTNQNFTNKLQWLAIFLKISPIFCLKLIFPQF